MKRSYVGVLLLMIILAMNIVFTQLLVHQYYYEDYVATLMYTGFNILLFPIAIYIYKKEKNKGGNESNGK
jgi:hypothetical protein